MKKIQSILALFLMPAAFSLLQAQSVARTATAAFGRHGGDCASGRGACAFNVQSTAAGSGTVKSSQKITETSVVLKISRSVLAREDEIKIAGKRFSDFTANETPTFQQQEQLILDSATLQNLGISANNNKIVVGTYPMVIYADRVEITFTLTN